MGLAEFDAWLRATPVACGLDDLREDSAFLTCGDFDCKAVHRQCSVSGISVPAGFSRWVNIKRSWSEHFNRKHTDGMRTMLAQMGLLDARGNLTQGFHHLGMHDVENICRCAFHLLEKGCFFIVNGHY